MWFFILTAALNFLSSVCLGLFVLLRAKENKVNRYFAYFCLAVSGLFLFYTLWACEVSRNNLVWAEFYQRTLMLCLFFLPPTVFQFIVHFLGRPMPAGLITLNYVLAASAAIFTYTPLFAHGPRTFNGIYWLQAGPVFYVLLAHFIIIVTYILSALYHAFRSLPAGLRRDQIKLVFIALLIGFISGSSGLLMWLNIPIKPYLNALVPLYVFIIAYAMVTRQLLDMDVIIKAGVVYTILASVITLIYLVLIFVSEHYLQGWLGYRSTRASLGMALLAALFLIPLKQWTSRLVERYMFKGTVSQILEQNRRLQQQLILSERYKKYSELANSLALSIKQPLAVLQEYGRHFDQHHKDAVFVDRFRGVLSAEIQRIQYLVDGLERYSRPEPLDLVRMNIYTLVRDVMSEMHPLLSSHHISVTKTYLENSVFFVNIDPKQLQKVLTNLISRAIKNMPEGGHLFVETGHNPTSFVISLKDTGLQIPQQELEKIFDPFHRFHEEEGRSLDLAIAFSIIESHGGRVFVNSHENEGNEFVVELPVVGASIL